MYYVLHGDDEFTRDEALADLKKQVLDEGMGDLNINVLDGRQIDLSELINICNTIPFLTTRRLVIVENLLQREPIPDPDEDDDEARPQGKRPAIVPGLLEYLPHLPATTRLVLLENRTLPSRHPLLKACRETKDCYLREFKRPGEAELPRWIERRARRHGVQIAPNAASLLAQYVSPRVRSRDEDTRPILRTLDAELAKLAAYQEYAGTIVADDVRSLVNRSNMDDIFMLVDALGMRQGRRAMQHLQQMLDPNRNELRLLRMITRQVRLILSAKEVAHSGRASKDEVVRQLHVAPFVAEKLLAQAATFSDEALARTHRLLADTEYAIKTGANPTLALEMLVVQACSRGTG